jgi:hypothetical protein
LTVRGAGKRAAGSARGATEQAAGPRAVASGLSTGGEARRHQHHDGRIAQDKIFLILN